MNYATQISGMRRRLMVSTAAGVCVATAALISASPAMADTFTVNTDTELLTALNAAAHNAAAADTITIASPVTLAGNATLGTGLTITSGVDSTIAGNLSDAAGNVFAGQWQVDQGPNWFFSSPPNGPLAYTGQEAAALLFGGLPTDYAISTIGTDPDKINFMAWYSIIGASGNQDNGGSLLPQNYVSKYLGLYYGPTSEYPTGDLGAPASAYVWDNASGATFTNYAFVAGTPQVGSLTKDGVGKLTLSGLNSYTGLTDVIGGTLELSGGQAIWDYGRVSVGPAGTLSVLTDETIGSLAGSGAVNLGANLVTGSNDDSTIFSGTISGAGSLAKYGTGSMVLSGANTYTGGTIIANGTLIGSASSFGTGTIMNNAALILDQPINADLANPIHGTGSLTKRGIGTLNLTGTSTLAGPTTVEAGGLRVNGSLANSAITLNSGTFLGGNGTTGAVSALAGSTVAPGNSVGTLNVSGNYIQDAGSTYVAETGPVGKSDLINVTGTAKIDPGAVLVLVQGEPLIAGTTYTVLTATYGVTGSYTFDGGLRTAFLGLIEQTTPTSVQIAYRQLRAFRAAGITPNQLATAGALDTITGSSAVVSALQVLPTDGAARAAFDQLSGEIHPAIRTVMTEDSRITRSAVLAHLAESDDTRGGAWIQAIGNWGESDGQVGIAKVKRDTVGMIGGFDLALTEGVRFGLAGAYTSTDVDLAQRASSGTIHSAHLLGYLGVRKGGFGLRAGVGYSNASVETTRNPAFAGFAQGLNGSYDGETLQAFGEAGYQLPLGGGSVEPIAAVAHVSAKTNAFTEVGGSAALHSESKREGRTTSTVAMRFATSTSGKFRVDGMVGWQHAYGDLAQFSYLSFAGSSPFQVASATQSRNSGVLQANASLAVTKSVSLNLAYNGVVGSDGQDHMLKGGLQIVF